MPSRLVSMCGVVAAVTWSVSSGCSSSREARPAPSVASVPPAAQAASEPELRAAPAIVEAGRLVFTQYCAVCHGEQGRGDGQAAYLLSPAPRNFAQGRFRLTSTQNGVPTIEDLVATVRRGMPGSAMSGWDWLQPADVEAVAHYVRKLAIDGLTVDLLRRAKEQDEKLANDEALAIAQTRMTPGAAIVVPPERPHDATTLLEGRRFYLNNCALCHDADGTGRSVKFQQNEDGTPATPRDFTAGVFKGGSTFTDICRRMLGGLSGSPMPATKFESDAQAAAVAAFVQSMVKPGAQERVVQKRTTVRAARVKTLPTEPGDPTWKAIEGTWLPLMPLWWRDRRVEGVVMRAVHDGERLAVQLTWEDSARDEELLGQDTFTDAAALQWSRDPAAPLFTMGAKGKPVSIWHWKAAWELDLPAVRDVAARYPNMPPDIHGVTDGPSEPLYLTASAAGNPIAARTRASAGEALTAEGFGTLAPVAGDANALRATGRWSEGFWDVVFVRPLQACCPGEATFEPGSNAYFATAVWDGSAMDRNGQKSVTVWHVLSVEQ